MPNGRGDIFEVKKDDFLSSTGVLKEDETIGATFDQPIDAPMKSVYLAELKKRVLNHEGETLVIEEQWNDYYIIRVGGDPYGWIFVTKESLLFSHIKQFHLKSSLS